MKKKSELLGIAVDEELEAIQDHKGGKPTLKQAVSQANKEEASNTVYQKELGLWDETLEDGI